MRVTKVGRFDGLSCVLKRQMKGNESEESVGVHVHAAVCYWTAKRRT